MSTQSDDSGERSIDEALAHAFAAFGPAYKRWTKTRLSEREIGYTHARALHLLRCKGPQIMSELGDDLGITPRYVTVLIDRMEGAGLVRRRPHPNDRRATLIELTDEGHRMCGATGDEHVEAAAELLQVLSPDQQQVLLEAMETLLCELQRRGFGPHPGLVLHRPPRPTAL
jgi:DNA-binding MarR family transcriptional regulator